jgi:AcrR family transcriptional regulator
VDLQAVATEAGVSRQTLHRWFGGREHLLADVLAMEAADTWREAVALESGGQLSPEVKAELRADGGDVDGRGVDRIAGVLSCYAFLLLGSRPYRALLADEGAVAVRVLTTARTSFQRREVLRLQRLMIEERSRGALTLRGEPEVIAGALTRIFSAFVVTDVVAGVVPDVNAALRMVRTLLDGDGERTLQDGDGERTLMDGHAERTLMDGRGERTLLDGDAERTLMDVEERTLQDGDGEVSSEFV